MTTRVSPDVSLGPVHIAVADLERSIDFYEGSIGLRVREDSVLLGAGERVGKGAVLGVGGTELLTLHEGPAAIPSVGYSGLFHFALLVPDRKGLAGWLSHAIREGVHLTGAADHFVSEAIYLDDPDGHGIEVYWDRPRAVWEGQVAERMTTLPLDFDDLLGEMDRAGAIGDTDSSLAVGAFDLTSGTIMGHVHLRVADVPSTIAFYRDVLGFDLMATYGARAAFLGAGGYHHHIGANTWGSAGAGQAPAGLASMLHMTLNMPDAAELDRLVERASSAGYPGERTDKGLLLRDPSGNGLMLVVAH